LKTKKEIKEVKSEESEDQVVCRTTMAKNIVRTVFKTDLPERNELFFPGRMAYTILMKSMSHRMIQTPQIHILTYQQLP